MGLFYPTAPASPAIETELDVDEVVQRTITLYDAGATKERAIGPALLGIDAPRKFDTLWAAIPKTRDAMLAVDPRPHDTVNAFKAALAAADVPGVSAAYAAVVRRNTDPVAWYNGLLARYGAANFTELKANWTPPGA